MNKWLFAKCGWKRPNSSLGSHVRSFGQKVGNRDPAYRQQATPLVGMREQQLLGATLCRRPRAASLTGIARPQTRGLSDVSLKSTDLNDPLHSRPICGHVPYRHWIMDGAERSMPARGKRWIMSSLPARPPGWPRPKRPMWRPAGNA